LSTPKAVASGIGRTLVYRPAEIPQPLDLAFGRLATTFAGPGRRVAERASDDQGAPRTRVAMVRGLMSARLVAVRVVGGVETKGMALDTVDVRSNLQLYGCRYSGA
jgi:hypothetical protein